ncbi:MAG TPA: N-acetylmuramoyl-L-alanine amidase, partial [Lacibacter sp.]|nr:N-acetylmuramoyl-L-alanine amidase [Lacibacter sp.]
VETKGKLPYLLVGLGEDRLGGTKIGYLDSLIRLRVTGKAGNKYRVQLSPYRHAYIEEQHVKVLPAGTLPPASLTGNITSRGDSAFDYVTLTLSERLPYQTYQELYPSRIVVEVFGATANTNWITQLQSARAVRQVYYRQAEDGIFRMTLELEDRQHWGHTVYYNGTNLVIRVRRRPASLDLRQLVIGVDAGHGGTNRGAAGITGVWEKDLTLLLARDVQQVLQSEGATVLMSRTTDATFDNHERYLFFRDRNPHVLLSIHLNSSGDPTRSKGIGMFYKHTGFHSLAQALLQRITGSTGLQEYGLVGNFNFLLNGYTEFPNALLETLFLSNPEEEALILDPVYRRQLALAIVSGLKDWLLLQQ